MENDRQSEKKNEQDESISEDDTLYVSASENQPVGEITIKLEHERKRKITIISECEPAEKKQQVAKPRARRDSVDLRRQAIVNNAIRSQRSASSCSRSRSRSRSRSVPRRGCSLSRTRSVSRGARSRSRSQDQPLQRTEQKAETCQVPIRLPTHLSPRSVFGTKSSNPPEFLNLPSPLFMLTEQQAIGVSEKKTVQFVTKVLLTSKKLSLDDRKKLYAEMVEAEYVGTSRSSSDLRGNSADEPEEEYECKIYYSDKGVYIHTVQNVKKIRSGKTSTISEEKVYTNVCKTKIIGEKGKSIDGWLNVSCSETVSVVNQLYTRSETFKIGLKDSNVNGKVTIGSTKSTFDPTKTTQFSEDILFDNKGLGILVNHKASAEMKDLWHHEIGSFGEEQSEYRELKFFFEDAKTDDKTGPLSVLTLPSTLTEPKQTPEESDKSDRLSRRSRSRSKRHKLMSRSMSLTKSNHGSKAASPDRRSSRVRRQDETPLKPSVLQDVNQTSTLNETIYHSLPRATSTPKSPANNSSLLLQSNVTQEVTPEEGQKRRGALSIREHRSVSPAVTTCVENEVDLDKSLGAKKPHARNLSAMVAEQKKEDVRKPTSPSSLCTFSTDTNTILNASAQSQKDSVSCSTPATTSPQGTLRVKETKVTREVRQETGKPAQISEKKEETVKEQKVKLRGRSKSPATPTTIRRSFQQTNDEKVITLSAVKTESVSMTPIKVSAMAETGQSSISGQKSFRESVQLDMLIDQKRLVFNLNVDILAEKRPEVDVVGFSFRGQKMWEKSCEWNITSANSTSQTKTIARQASNIENDEKKESEEKN